MAVLNGGSYSSFLPFSAGGAAARWLGSPVALMRLLYVVAPSTPGRCFSTGDQTELRENEDKKKTNNVKFALITF